MPLKRIHGKRFSCPMCDYTGPWGDLVKHFAYKGDSKHQLWRVSHDFPIKMAFGSHNELKFRISVMSEFSDKDISL